MKRSAVVFLVLLALCLCAVTAFAQEEKPALSIADAASADLTPYLPDYQAKTGKDAPGPGETPSVLICAKWAGEGELTWSVNKPKKVALREVEGEPLARRVVWLSRPQGAKNASLSVTVTVKTPTGATAKRTYRFGYRPGTITLTSKNIDKSVDPPQTVLAPGVKKPVQMKAEIWPAPGKYNIGKKFTWASSDTSVATVKKKNGKVTVATAEKGKTALITATHVKTGMTASQVVAVKGQAQDAVIAPPSFTSDPAMEAFVQASYENVTYVDASGAERTVKSLTHVDWNVEGNPQDGFYIRVNPLSGAAVAKDEYAGLFGRITATSSNEDVATAAVVRDQSSPYYQNVYIGVNRYGPRNASTTISISVAGSDPRAKPVTTRFSLDTYATEIKLPTRLVANGPASITKGETGAYSVATYYGSEPISAPTTDTVWTVTPNNGGETITFTGSAYTLDTKDSKFADATGADIEAKLTLFSGTSAEINLEAQKILVSFSDPPVPIIPAVAYPDGKIAGDGSAARPYALQYVTGDTLKIDLYNFGDISQLSATCQKAGESAFPMTRDPGNGSFCLPDTKYAPGDLLTVTIRKGTNVSYTMKIALIKVELEIVSPAPIEIQPEGTVYDLASSQSLSVRARSVFPDYLPRNRIRLVCTDKSGERGTVTYSFEQWTVSPGNLGKIETLTLETQCQHGTDMRTVSKLDVQVCGDTEPARLVIAPAKVKMGVATPITVRLVNQYGILLREMPCGVTDAKGEIVSSLSSYGGTVDSGNLTLSAPGQTAVAQAQYLGSSLTTSQTITVDGLSCRLEAAQLSAARAVFRICDLTEGLQAGDIAVFRTEAGQAVGTALAQGDTAEMRVMDISGLTDFTVAAFLSGVRVSEELGVGPDDLNVASLSIEPTRIHYGVETFIYAVARNAEGAVLGKWTIKDTSTESRLAFSLTPNDGYTTGDGEIQLNSLSATAAASATWTADSTATPVTTGGVTITAMQRVANSIQFTVAAAKPDFTSPGYKQNSIVCVGDTGMRVYFYALDEAGNVFPLEKMGVTSESSDGAILTVGALDENDSAPLTPVQAGSAYVILKDADRKAIGTYPVTVRAQRKEATLRFDKQSLTIGQGASGTVVATVLDQYGDAMSLDIAKGSVTLKQAPTTGAVTATPSLTTDQKGFSILFSADGTATGNAGFSVQYGSLSAYQMLVRVGEASVPTSLRLDRDTLHIGAGESGTVGVSVLDQYQNPMPDTYLADATVQVTRRPALAGEDDLTASLNASSQIEVAPSADAQPGEYAVQVSCSAISTPQTFTVYVQ